MQTILRSNNKLGITTRSLRRLIASGYIKIRTKIVFFRDAEDPGDTTFQQITTTAFRAESDCPKYPDTEKRFGFYLAKKNSDIAVFVPFTRIGIL